MGITVEILLVYGLIIAAMVLFAVDRIPFDFVAMLLVSLLLSGILEGQDAFSAFSNPATVAIGAMFVLSNRYPKNRLIGVTPLPLNFIILNQIQYIAQVIENLCHCPCHRHLHCPGNTPESTAVMPG